ncbi:MAG: TIGR03905 family TSCPD domain-containing protein [Gracilibacteraceae bacterium]|nr:TIGR03905 family TSCPD domain-containing protein [Gracilibacteraceae bacterium]
MRHSYKMRGTCATEVSFDLDGHTVSDIRFTRGCDGNLQAVAVLAEGLSAERIEALLGGIDCGGRGTSCPDQLARAVRAALEE